MPAPSAPQNLYVTQADGKVYLQWSASAGATTYSVQRSTDNITFSSLATPAAPEYLDSAVTVGTTYWYKVASINGSGTGIYTEAQSAVPTLGGEVSLGQLRLMAQQRADRVGSNFVTTPEWNSYINQSMFELYDILVTAYEDYFVATPAQFTCNGTTYLYPLPDGGTSFTNSLNNQSFIAPAFYKLIGVDLSLNTANNGWVTVNRFNFIDRNRYIYPNSASTIYGVFNLQYRIMGNNIEFIPTPSSGQSIRLWYIPRMTQLLKDSDITATSISGWIEYVIIDAAIKALQKEESDVTVLALQKQALIQRIQSSAPTRDAGIPDRISDTRKNSYGGDGWGFGWNGNSGGF